MNATLCLQAKYANSRHLRLLCPRRDRPRCRAAEQRDELASPHIQLRLFQRSNDSTPRPRSMGDIQRERRPASALRKERGGHHRGKSAPRACRPARSNDAGALPQWAIGHARRGDRNYLACWRPFLPVLLRSYDPAESAVPPWPPRAAVVLKMFRARSVADCVAQQGLPTASSRATSLRRQYYCLPRGRRSASSL